MATITEGEALTLVRLAATIHHERLSIVGMTKALCSFSEPAEVQALAERVAAALYDQGEDLTIVAQPASDSADVHQDARSSGERIET